MDAEKEKQITESESAFQQYSAFGVSGNGGEAAAKNLRSFAFICG